MITNHFLRTLITAVCLIICICGAALAQEPSDGQLPANVTIVGGGGFPVENEKIMNGSGMEAFGPVYSSSNDFQITLKDVYITDGLAVITLSIGTSHSASNHVSSASVYVNGEQRGGGGSTGELIGEPYEHTMTLVFYGDIFDAKLGTEWDNLRVSFDGLILAAYAGETSGYLGAPENYSWSYVFHNPAGSRYTNEGFDPTTDERGIHTFGNQINIELSWFSAGKDMSFDFIRKSGLVNLYGSQTAVWVNDMQRGGGGSSVLFDAEGNPEVDGDSQFIQTDHFLYQDADITPDSLAVWAQSITIELNCAGTPRTSTKVLIDEKSFPMKLVQFVQ